VTVSNNINNMTNK